MQTVDDIRVNRADDFVLVAGDVSLEPIRVKNNFRNAQRRLSARQDDCDYMPEICAGIESILQSYISDISLSELEQSIRSSLTRYGLFQNREINVYFDKSQGNKLGVLVSFGVKDLGTLVADEDLVFSVYLDIQNQRSYQ